ncbi:hypothetical protein F5Y16DRAFT_243785 [Xylariaceae sp. FL0255]|nr:hypothetical protein F5Y16DRAFT_243785 [Xylariaceae sp. FL0255]
MTEYTSSIEGFQRAMERSLTILGKEHAESFETPSFYHILNGERINYDDHVKDIDAWREKISEYKPVVDHFLRDGDQLAAHMVGTCKVEGVESAFESFFHAKVDKESGKLEWLIERSVWGLPGQTPDQGVN